MSEATQAADPMHRTLARQLRRLALDGNTPPVDADTWRGLVEVVSLSYTEADEERYTLERSATISSAEMRGLHEVLSQRARQDVLTGLPNRAALLEHLCRVLVAWRRSPHPVGVLFVDLDGFKLVNDSLGHAAGDELLVRTSERIQSCLRAGDVVARLGGDEFVVVIESRAGADLLPLVADRIGRQLAAPFRIGDRDAVVGASIGLTCVESDADTGEDLLRRADLAMYAAKGRGKGRICVYDGDMQHAVDTQLSVQSALGNAVRQNELRVHYQPVVSLDDGRVLGAEALVRWERPGHGLVPPDQFIPIAESSALVADVDCWVLQEACWRAAGWCRRGGSLAVNVSARTLESSRYLQMVAAMLAETGIPPGSLVLEITETVLLGGASPATRMLQQLRELGVRLSVDDFGTGYSSLAQLATTSVDVLKIDRSFVQAMDSDPAVSAVVSAIVAMARALGHGIVAEGIERPEQAAMLRALGCEAAQGWLYGRPGDAAVIDAAFGLAPAPTPVDGVLAAIAR